MADLQDYERPTFVDGVPVYNRGAASDDDVRSVLASQAMGIAAQAPPAGQHPSVYQEFAKSLPPFAAYALNAWQYISDRMPDSMAPLDMPPEALQAIQEEHPKASAAGQAMVPLTTALALPGKILPQAAAAGALEALRGGSTPLSIVKETGTAAAFQGAGNMATRVVSGISNGINAMRGGSTLRSTSPALRTIGEMGAGKGVIDDINQRVLLRDLGKIFGIDKMDDLGAAQLAAGADNIGAAFDDALTLTGKIDLDGVAKELADIPGSNFPGKRALMQQIASLNKTDNSTALRALHRALRDKAASMRTNPQLAGYADEVQSALGLLDDAATKAGADVAALGKAGQRWKVLKTIEETPDAWISGRINGRQLASKFGRESSKGFGTTLKRGRLGKLDDDVGSFLDDLMNVAGDPTPFGNSGTADRALLLGGSVGGFTALTSGAIDPATAGLGVLAYGVVPPIAGAASVGRPVGVVGQALVGTRDLTTGSD